MIAFPNMCVSCVHYKRSESYDYRPPTCAAFPGGIPSAVWQGGLAHVDPLADERLTYELSPGMEDALDAYLDYWFIIDDEPRERT